MAKKVAQAPKIYKAEAPAAANGVVWRIGAELTVAAAISIRNAGGNVVVCGSDKKENRKVAQLIEDAVGPWVVDKPHKNSAGAEALPHFHQRPNTAGKRIPAGHTFYEVDRTKAKKKP